MSPKFKDWILIYSLNYIISNKIQNIYQSPWAGSLPARKEQNRKNLNILEQVNDDMQKKTCTLCFKKDKKEKSSNELFLK